MTKYYYLVAAILWGLYGYSQEQGCILPSFLEMTDNWTGDLDRFLELPDGSWQLDDSLANETTIEFRPDSLLSGFQISFSLGFAPSLSNQFSMTVNLKSPHSVDSASVTFTIGEGGSQDGLQVQYRTSRDQISEFYFWEGEYGSGATRASWEIYIGRTGLTIRNIGLGKQESIPILGDLPTALSISEIILNCQYTRTRANQFTFHRAYPNKEGTGLDPHPGDIFISEYKIAPRGGESEDFIELYHNFGYPGCLNGLRLEINGVNLDIPPLRVEPGRHIVVTDVQNPLKGGDDANYIQVHMPDVAEYEAVEMVLFLFDRRLHGVRISAQQATEDGRSHEMIDVSRPCRTDNWAPSRNVTGTPGAENSWFSTLDDLELRLDWLTPSKAVIKMPFLIFSPIEIKGKISANYDMEVGGNFFWGELELKFPNPPGTLDTLKVKVEGAFPLCGTILYQDTIFSTIIPTRGKESGLLITEIMYQPTTGCPEYLEITNMEDIPTWWDGLQLVKNEGMPVLIPVLGGWPPNQSRLYTEDRLQFLDCYPETLPELIYEVDLFALNNNGAALTLGTNDSEVRIIDEISYSPGTHNFLIKNTTGVVLERNIFGRKGNKWRSGFVQFSYRSPGFLPDWDLSTGIEIEFSTSVVYTGTEREPSQLTISVGTESLDGSITIEIFDLNGSNVQTLANAVPVQGGEIFNWTGRSPNGQLYPEGLYLFWIYYFDSLGHRKTLKKTCVLSNK